VELLASPSSYTAVLRRDATDERRQGESPLAGRITAPLARDDDDKGEENERECEEDSFEKTFASGTGTILTHFLVSDSETRRRSVADFDFVFVAADLRLPGEVQEDSETLAHGAPGDADAPESVVRVTFAVSSRTGTGKLEGVAATIRVRVRRVPVPSGRKRHDSEAEALSSVPRREK
jgi:hypothetical protein